MQRVDQTELPYRVVPRALSASSNASAAVQAIHDALYAAYGCGEVRFPEGVFRVNLTLNERMSVVGAGWRATTLKSVAGANAAVVQGRDFATLTGKTKATGDYLRGAYGVRIADLTIDGDKTTNTSAGCGLRLWGAAPVIERVIARDCRDDGISTEFTDHDGFTDDDEHVQGFFRAIKCINNGGNGWTHRGPHDSILHDYVAFNNGGWALKTESGSGTYSGGISVDMANSFLNTNSFYIGAGGWWSNCAATAGNTGNGFEIASGVGSVRIVNAAISGHTSGLIMRGSENSFTGNVRNCRNAANTAGDGITLDGCADCFIEAWGATNVNAVNVISESQGNILIGVFNQSGKTLKTGASFNLRSYVRLWDTSNTNSAIMQEPQGTIQTQGALKLGSTGGAASGDPLVQRITGSPEGVTTAPPGSLCLETGGALYRKASGTGNTGWVQLSRLTATAVLDFGSIAAQSCDDTKTITVTGAAVGDAVQLGPPAGLEAGLTATGLVTAADTVRIRLCNVTSGAIDPASATWRATVAKG